MSEILYIVIPCFNERDVLPETAEILRAKLIRLKENGIIDPASRVLFVNNHSEDGTFEYIAALTRKHPESFTGISLSANCGQQNALLAGLETAVEYADIMITMDADLQDDPDVINEMLKKHAEGAEIVYGVRNNRKSDTFFKRATASLYYRVARMLGLRIDFSLLRGRFPNPPALREPLFSDLAEMKIAISGGLPIMTNILFYDVPSGHHKKYLF